MQRRTVAFVASWIAEDAESIIWSVYDAPHSNIRTFRSDHDLIETEFPDVDAAEGRAMLTRCMLMTFTAERTADPGVWRMPLMSHEERAAIHNGTGLMPRRWVERAAQRQRTLEEVKQETARDFAQANRQRTQTIEEMLAEFLNE